MARIGPPIVLAKCHCGEILIKDYPDTKPYWTKYQIVQIYVKNLKRKGLKIKSKKCPGHGGSPHIKIGSFYHPSIYLPKKESK